MIWGEGPNDFLLLWRVGLFLLFFYFELTLELEIKWDRLASLSKPIISQLGFVTYDSLNYLESRFLSVLFFLNKG